jgi:hypothetical protein
MTEKLNHQEYRDNLAEEIKQEPDKNKRREILETAKLTEDYQEARKLKIEKINQAVETQENLEKEREEIGLEPKPSEIITTRQAIKELESLQTERPPYSFEQAKEEKPLMHYSKDGNIFQILRFGIQSNNFKSRFNELRTDNPTADNLAKQMCGLRIKQGGSYQEPDSISLSTYQDSMHASTNNILYLINPEIKTFGGEDEEREQTGYGHGIKKRTVGGEYQVGNPTAYGSEVLAANIICPKEIMAVVIDKYTTILSGMNKVVSENCKIYAQQRKSYPNGAEDLVSTARLVAELADKPEIVEEAEELQQKIQNQTISSQEIYSAVNTLQKKALAEFVGTDVKLTEDSLRKAIEKKFNISFLVKP